MTGRIRGTIGLYLFCLFFSKIFEKTKLKRVLSFLDAKKFFTGISLVFGRSAQQNTHVICFYFVRQSLDFGLVPAAIFLDVKKAFDSLTHEILIGKLRIKVFVDKFCPGFLHS